MSDPVLAASLRNLTAWSLQVGVLAVMAAVFSRLLPIERPRVRLAFDQALLALVLALPLVQPWQSATTEVDWAFALAALGASPSAAGGGALSPAVAPAWSALVGGLLLLGLIVQLARLGVGFVRLRSLQGRSRAWEAPPWLAALRDELAPKVLFLISVEAGTPATCGWRRPVILLPGSFESMDRDRQRAIAAHELFHARRGDWVALVLEELLKAVLFFHPAVHWLVGRVRLAREQTVDAAVVRRLGAREVYLESLLEVARQGIRARAVPAAPFLRESHLRERVDLLLKEVVMSRARTQINAGITAAAILLAVSWAVSAAPLQNAPQQSSESKPSPDKAASGEPKLLHKVDPVYPEAAKADKAEGMFQVAIVVGKDGGVRDATVVASSSTPGRLDEPSALNGDPRLAQAALEAVRLWRYEPILKNGQPVEAKMTITINFRLS